MRFILTNNQTTRTKRTEFNPLSIKIAPVIYFAGAFFTYRAESVTVLETTQFIRKNVREICVGVLIILISASMIGAFNGMTAAIGWLRSIDRNTYQTSQVLETMGKRLDAVETDVSMLKSSNKPAQGVTAQ